MLAINLREELGMENSLPRGPGCTAAVFVMGVHDMGLATIAHDISL